MNPPLDYSRLALRGDGVGFDSVSLALVAAAHLLGREADYETVFCQTANAFAPSIDLREDCTSHWHVCAFHATPGLAQAARRLGLEAVPLPMPAATESDAGTGGQELRRRRCAAVLHSALDRGEVVMATGGWDTGWDPPGPHGFVHWGFAGIVTQADPATGLILGAHPNGYLDNPIAYPDGFWVITRGGDPVPSDQADLAMLRLAIDRIRGEGIFAPSAQIVNGLQAVDAWIRQMREVRGFCAPCFSRQGADIGDAPDNARRMVAGARAAAQQLRRIASQHPGTEIRQGLDTAAARYDRIADLLEPALLGKGGPRYAEFVGDIGKQQAFAETVLLPVRHELAAIAQQLEQAVTALLVRRQGGKVWIPDVPPAPAEGNGYLRGLESMLAQQGAPVSYDRLMALSGMAFITQADSAHRWDGKVDVGWWPLDVWGLDLRREFLGLAVGYELRAVGAVNSTAEQFLALRDQLPTWYRSQLEPHVRSSIDAGRPLLAIADFGTLITGYDGATDKPPLFGRCARATDPEQARFTHWPWGLLVLAQRTPPMETDAADMAALRHALALVRDQAGPFAPEWRDRRFTGQKAYAAWAAVLRDTAGPVEDRHHANMKYRLIDNRQSAIRFLDGVADRLGGEAAAPLRQAAAIYGEVVGLLAQIDCDGLAARPDQRLATADLVERVADRELNAATYMERGITLMTVKHDSYKTWIDLPGFDAGQYASSVHGAQARILETLGETLSYQDLICYSGFAFRIGVHEALCPSAGHPSCGYRCYEAQNALPWAARVYLSLPWDPAKADQAAFEAEVRTAVKASIDRGVPVHYGSEEDGLIIGYAEEGRRWWCVHPYQEGGRTAFWHDEVKGFGGGAWPWGIEIWTGPKPADQRPDERALTLAALRQAVDMWTTEKTGAYFGGEAAYAHWLDWLRRVEAGQVEDPKAGMQGNGWCFDVLVHSRRIAGPWLRAKAESFTGQAREQLLLAADHYSQIAAVCMEGLSCPWDLAPGPGKADQWTSAARQRQIERLEAARDHDRAAVAAIGNALAAAR